MSNENISRGITKMDNFFTALATWFETAGLAAEGHGVLFVIVGIFITATVIVLWMAFFDAAWVAHSVNPTNNTRAELIVAIVAPISVPALLIAAAVKWTISRKTVIA